MNGVPSEAQSVSIKRDQPVATCPRSGGVFLADGVRVTAARCRLDQVGGNRADRDSALAAQVLGPNDPGL
jgi:hypothetical protein